VSKLDYRQLALELLCATHPKEKRRPPTELEQNEHVQAATLRYLLEHDNEATPAQLIEFFQFSHARLTKILGNLEEKGLIRRDTDPRDRRRVIVRLTQTGYGLAAEQREEMLGHLAAVLETLGEEDAVHFLRIAKKFAAMETLPPPTDDSMICERKRIDA